MDALSLLIILNYSKVIGLTELCITQHAPWISALIVIVISQSKFTATLQILVLCIIT